jgi:hypothetical protein
MPGQMDQDNSMAENERAYSMQGVTDRMVHAVSSSCVYRLSWAWVKGG